MVKIETVEVYDLATPSIEDEINIAWAAGLFEGEGCIFFSYTGDHIQARVEIRMTDKDVLERFALIVDRGEVKSRNYDQAPNSKKRVYKWGLYDAEGVRYVLNLLMPHLGERRSKKAQEALKAISHIKAQGRRQ